VRYDENDNKNIPIFNYDTSSLQKFSLIFANFIMSDAIVYDKSNSPMCFANVQYAIYTGSNSWLCNVCFRNK